MTIGSAIALPRPSRSRISQRLAYAAPRLRGGLGRARVLWLVAHADRAGPRARRRPPAASAPVPLAWRLVAAFFLMSSVFYGLERLAARRVRRARPERGSAAAPRGHERVTIPAGFWLRGRPTTGAAARWLAGAAALSWSRSLGILLRAAGRLALGRAPRVCDRPALPVDDDPAARRLRAPGRGGRACRDDAGRRLHARPPARRCSSARPRRDRRFRRGVWCYSWSRLRS